MKIPSCFLEFVETKDIVLYDEGMVRLRAVTSYEKMVSYVGQFGWELTFQYKEGKHTILTFRKIQGEPA